MLVAQIIQSKAIDYIDDLLDIVVGALVGFFGGRICADVEALAAAGHHLTVDLVDGVVLIDEFVGIRDNLVTGNDVLFERILAWFERGRRCSERLFIDWLLTL